MDTRRHDYEMKTSMITVTVLYITFTFALSAITLNPLPGEVNSYLITVASLRGWGLLFN